MRTSGVIGVGLLMAVFLAGCEEGPGQKTGKKIDRALDRLSGKGPVEKAGEKVDKAVEELKK